MRIVASVWALKSLTVGPAVRRAWNSAGPAEARGQMFPALGSRNRPLSLNRKVHVFGKTDTFLRYLTEPRSVLPSCSGGRGCKRASPAQRVPVLGGGGLSSAPLRRPGVRWPVPLLFACLPSPTGWVTLPGKVGKIHQWILYGALKIARAEGEKEMMLKMEISPFLSLCFFLLFKSTFKCTIKGNTRERAATMGRWEPETSSWRSRFAVGRTKMQI